MHDAHVHRHIHYGALSAYIVRGEEVYDATAIAVQVEHAEPWISIPFGRRTVERLIAIDERYFIALGRQGMNEGFCMAVLDSTKRRTTSRIASERIIIRGSHLVVSQDRKLLWHVNAHECRRWSLPDLTEREPLKAPFLHVRETAMRDDGAIVAKGDDVNNDYGGGRPAPPLLFIIAPEGDRIESRGVSRLKEPDGYGASDLFVLSPKGNYLSRVHQGSLGLVDANGAPISDWSEFSDVADGDLIATLKRLFLQGAQELWTVDPFEFRDRFVVRTLSLFDCLTKKPEQEGIGAGPRRDEAIEEYVRLRDRGGDAEEIKAAQEKAKRLYDLNHNFVMARWLLRTAVQFAPVAPLHKWVFGDAPLSERLPPEERFKIANYLGDALTKVMGSSTHWEVDERAFLVRFGDGQERRVELDGALGPLEASSPLPRPDAELTPPPLKQLAQAAIAKTSVPEFKLKGLDERACLKAIDDLAKRLRRGAEEVVWGRDMVLHFVHPGGTMSEQEFFAFVAENCPNAVPNLRALMAAFDASGMQPEEVWSTDLVSASGFPALALARLDPQAFTALEGYYARRDTSHEPWGLETVFPALAPFRTIEGINFALARLLEENVYGHGDTVLVAKGATERIIAKRLLSDARAVCTPDALFAATMELARRHAEETQSSVKDLRSSGLLEPLLSAAEPNDPWDDAFAALARRNVQ